MINKSTKKRKSLLIEDSISISVISKGFVLASLTPLPGGNELRMSLRGPKGRSNPPEIAAHPSGVRNDTRVIASLRSQQYSIADNKGYPYCYPRRTDREG